MITTFKEAAQKGRSPLNIGRSTERNSRKQARGAENNRYRASLHQQKVNARGQEDKDRIQRQLDEIRNRS